MNTIYKNKLPQYKYHFLVDEYNHNTYNNNNNIYINKNNNDYNRDRNNKTNIINSNIYNKILQENNHLKNNSNTKNNSTIGNNEKIIRKINSFHNGQNSNIFNNNFISNEKDVVDLYTDVGMRSGSVFNNSNYSYVNINDYNDYEQNKKILNNNRSVLSENIKYKNYLKKYKNNNYYNNNNSLDISKDSDIQIKSPIREVIKKLIKNKNQINESFSNFFNLTNGLHNKSFELNHKNHKINNNDSLIDKIKNSENLSFYFSEKYGDGNFESFLNNFKKNKINHQLVEKEIDVIDKIMENNINKNKNIINNNNIKNEKYKNNYGRSIDSIIKNNRNTQYKSINNKTNKKNKKDKDGKNRIVYHKTQKKYKTGNPSFRDDINDDIDKYDINNNNKNQKGHQISPSFVDNFLKTDGLNSKSKNILPSNFILDKGINFAYRRFKTPIIENNNFRNYSFK
jgi:hypothetical protein